MRGADLIVSSLSSAGVEVIFSLSGNQIMPIYDACIDAGIRIVHTRHEGAAVYMAEAYAQLTGKVGVAMITAGPGFASGLGPLVTARASETPVLLLSGDSPRSQDGRGCFQELDQVSISQALTKWSHRPAIAANLGLDVTRAVRIARSCRPGPVHLALPFDLLNESVESPTLPAAVDFEPEHNPPDATMLTAVAEALQKAQRPLVLTGPRLNRSRGPEAAALETAFDVPVVAMESPRGLKDPCLGNFAAVLSQADLVVALGKQIDHTTGYGQTPPFGKDCRVIVIDSDEAARDRAERALGERLVFASSGNAVETAAALAAIAQVDGDRAEWRAQVSAAISARPVEPPAGDGPMRPAILCAAVQRLLDRVDNPLLIIDGGEFGQWAQAFISAPVRMINGVSGCIGGSIGYAIAAKIAHPDATVVALMGDGTAGFHFAEFETAQRYGIDFVAVIGHDARWNAEVQIQLREYGADRVFETELNSTRYDRAAMAFGCHGEHVSDPAELDAALDRAAASGLPACFVCEIEGLPAPAGAGH